MLPVSGLARGTLRFNMFCIIVGAAVPCGNPVWDRIWAVGQVDVPWGWGKIWFWGMKPFALVPYCFVHSTASSRLRNCNYCCT